MFLLPVTEGNETETSGNTVECNTNEKDLLIDEEENKQLHDIRAGLIEKTQTSHSSTTLWKWKVDPVKKKLLEILEKLPQLTQFASD